MNTVILSQMWNGSGDHMGGDWWWVMGIGWLIFLALLVVLSVVFVRYFTQSGPSRRAAEDVLAERFARGEIDEDEYRQRRDVIRR